MFLCQILALLVVARALGWLLGRVGQPAVVGELLAGVVAGPSILGRAAPDVSDWLFPSTEVQGAMLYGLAWVGLLLLLAATGFESDLGVLRRLGRPALWVTAGSLFVPLIVGFGTGFAVPDELLGPEATTVAFAAFLAVALSISSLPVVARVLGELDLIRRNVGQLILAAAMANDVVGWILLGLVAGLAEAGGVDAFDLVLQVAGVTAFLVLALTVGQRLVDAALRSVASASPTTTSPTTLVIGIIVGAGALTQWMGVEAVLGAFVAGLVIGRSTWRDERVLRLIETVAAGILAPLFFATAGLKVDLGVFTDPTVALWSVIIVVVASATKFVGSILGARAGGLPSREGLALGVALNARGALEIVIAAVGLSIGVLNDASYGVIVVMAIVTSLAAPPLLRIVLADWQGTPEEQLRLDAEKAARTRVIISERPPMLASRGEAPSIVASQLLDLCWPRDAPVTVVAGPDDTPELDAVRNVLGERDVRMVRHDGASEAAALLTEANRGHGVMFVGLADRPGEPAIPAEIDDVLAAATMPVVLVRGERMSGRSLPGVFAKALVPVTGSVNSRASQEVAAALSASIGTELVLTHLDPVPAMSFDFGGDGTADQLAMAEPLLRTASDSAALSGAGRVSTRARRAESVPGELARIAVEDAVDVVFVGATRRQAPEGTYLGPVVSHLLEVCPATVVVVVTPVGWSGRH